MRDAYGQQGETLGLHFEFDGPCYLLVEPSQVSAVRAVLDATGVTYSLEPDGMRMGDGKPAATVFIFDADADTDKIIEVLDASD